MTLYYYELRIYYVEVHTYYIVTVVLNLTFTTNVGKRYARWNFTEMENM